MSRPEKMSLERTIMGFTIGVLTVPFAIASLYAFKIIDFLEGMARSLNVHIPFLAPGTYGVALSVISLFETFALSLKDPDYGFGSLMGITSILAVFIFFGLWSLAKLVLSDLVFSYFAGLAGFLLALKLRY